MTFLLSGALCGFGSCSGRISDLCQKELPGYERRFDEAELRLKEEASRPARALASESSSKHGPFTEDESEAWMDWAEKGLKETQAFMDVAESDPLPNGKSGAIRKELSSLANEWVSFHGFGNAGKLSQMSGCLERIRAHARAARKIACEN